MLIECLEEADVPLCENPTFQWETLFFAGVDFFKEYTKLYDASAQLKYPNDEIDGGIFDEPSWKYSKISTGSRTISADKFLNTTNMNSLNFKDSTSFNGLVLRNTRFSVTVPLNVAIKRFANCYAQMDVTVDQKRNTEALVTFKPNMSFMVNIYEFSHSNETRVIIDCRRSRGCGLAFKRIFNHLKGKMQPLIFRDDDIWMRNAGLIRRH